MTRACFLCSNGSGLCCYEWHQTITYSSYVEKTSVCFLGSYSWGIFPAHNIWMDAFSHGLGHGSLVLKHLLPAFFKAMICWSRVCWHCSMFPTGTSLMGWGVALLGHPAHTLRWGPHLSSHINCMKVRAVFLVQNTFFHLWKAQKFSLPESPLLGCRVIWRGLHTLHA